VNFIDVMARKGDPGYATAWPYVPGLEVVGYHPLGGRRVHGAPYRVRIRLGELGVVGDGLEVASWDGAGSLFLILQAE
jgi:NADPH2:quinone reductase